MESDNDQSERSGFRGIFPVSGSFFFLCGNKTCRGPGPLPAHIFNSIQAYMLEKRFDGWLFSGQGSFDDIEKDFLGLSGKTRYRWFIFIPGIASHRKPYLIYHKADERVFSGINFYPLPYRSRDEMLKEFSERLFPIAQKLCQLLTGNEYPRAFRHRREARGYSFPVSN